MEVKNLHSFTEFVHLLNLREQFELFSKSRKNFGIAYNESKTNTGVKCHYNYANKSIQATVINNQLCVEKVVNNQLIENVDIFSYDELKKQFLWLIS